MLIRIESVYGDRVLSGDPLDRQDLQKALDGIMQMGNGHLPSVFCARFCALYGYREVQNREKVPADFLMDLDTSLVFALVHG